MKGKRILATMLLALVALPCSITAQDNEEYDFAISKGFLAKLVGDGIEPTVSVKMNSRTKRVHTLANDCEIHMAATPQQWSPGNPPDIVVEPPNVCKFPPPGARRNASATTSWPLFLDTHVMGKTCAVKGFPRIFTEHAQGKPDPANPNHVFELHPAVSINCDGSELSFSDFLVALPGMRAIKPATAASCIQSRKLEVRFADGEYQLREQGGQCGNFAIVEIGNLNPTWIREIKGGHSAIARVSADGMSQTTLKIYTLAGSTVDTWLAGVKQKGLGSARTLVHGMFTYDYFQIVKAVRSRDEEWTEPKDWTRVEFPLALVLFGETETVPWEEQ
jgi:hypothetical protein